MVARGQPQQIAEEFSLALLWATVAGFPLAWHKSDGGSTVKWIGAQISVAPAAVEIRIPEDRVTELLSLVRGALSE